MITLQEIKTKQAELGELIAKFEAQTHDPRTFDLPAACIVLEPGEHYAGIILGKDGDASYHLILMPGEADALNFADAEAWAQKASGGLPLRREQALLFANLKEQFKDAYYWSGEQHAAHSDYAWCQDFRYGYQYCLTTHGKLRARAVRRICI